MRYPATSEMIHRASEAWANPLGSRSRTKALLKRLFDRHYISRQEIPTPGRGNNPMLYYLSPRASELCPELEELAARVRKGKRCPLFRGLSESPHHTLAASSFCAELELISQIKQGLLQRVKYPVAKGEEQQLRGGPARLSGAVGGCRRATWQGPGQTEPWRR
jgi:hypothetical protein